MAATTYSARQVAREVSKRLGRDIDAKRVRAWVRDNVPAYDDDGYTAHAYSHAEFARIVAALVERGRQGRPTAAAKGRSGKAAQKPTSPSQKPKTPRTARVMGSGPVPRNSAATEAPSAPKVE